MDHSRQLLTLEEAAEFLGVSKTSLRRWTNDGRLNCHRVGVRRERRFDLDELESFLAQGADQEGGPDLPGPARSHYGPVDQPGDDPGHVCTHFRGKGEQWRMIGPHVARFLRAGWPVHYLHDPDRGLSALDIGEALRADGVDADTHVRAGLLCLVPVKMAYLPKGRFSASRMVDFIEAIILKRRADGFDKVLLTGEMSWFLSGVPGVHEIHEYEDRLNGLRIKYPGASMVCQYDSDLFDGANVLTSLCTHPSVMLADRIVPGFFAGKATGRSA